MIKKTIGNRGFPTVTIEQLKKYGYSAAIMLGLFSASTVLLFGSPTFSLSPATAIFDRLVYPVIIVLGLLLIWAILSGRLVIQKFEKPMVGFGALFFVSKLSLTLLAAPTVLSLAYAESWYWMMIGIWTASFLTYTFYPALFINLAVYITAVAVNITHVWLKADPAVYLDSLTDIAASTFRVSASLTFLVILGYVKHQWVLVEKEAMLLRDIAHTDALTGLPNRRQLSDMLQAASESPQGSLTIILFDLDGFKEINDHFGHAAGDEVLRQIGTLAQDCVGTHDTIGRWGGEEFLILCPNTGLADGVGLAERVRLMLASHKIIRGRSITGSFGVAELQPGETAEQLIVRADQALYAAKKRGKNRVLAAGSGSSPSHFHSATFL